MKIELIMPPAASTAGGILTFAYNLLNMKE